MKMIQVWFGASLVALLVALLAACGLRYQVSAGDQAFGDASVELLMHLSQPESLYTYPNREVIDNLPRPDTGSAQWPIDVFLRGESYLLREEFDTAREEYNKLVSWGAGDRRGGMGLVSIALWRLLHGDNMYQEGYQLRELLENSAALLLVETAQHRPPSPCQAAPVLRDDDEDGKLPRLLFERTDYSAFYSNLMWFEEDILQKLVDVTHKLGDPRAADWFRRSLGVRTDIWFSDAEQTLFEDMISRGEMSRNDFLFDQARRLSNLGRYTAARNALGEVLRDGSVEASVEARLEIAGLWRRSGESSEDVLALLNSIVEEIESKEKDDDGVFFDLDLTQCVQLARARAYNRSDERRSDDAALADFDAIVERHKRNSSLSRNDDMYQDALYQVGRIQGRLGEVEAAEEAYAELRKINSSQGDNRTESAYFYPALLRYRHGDPAAALDLLEKLEDSRLNNPLHIAALFWMGRMYEELGKESNARDQFSRVIDETRLTDGADSYYAVRSKMHLFSGSDAREQFLPDGETVEWLADKYARPDSDRAEDRSSLEAISFSQPHFSRLQWAFGDNDLYAEVARRAAEWERTGLAVRSEPFVLDASGLLPSVAIRASLFMDAWRTKQEVSAPALMQLAERFGEAGDWTYSYLLLQGNGAAADVPGYLRGIYPCAFVDEVSAAAAEYQVEPEILYAMMRRESLFSPGAESPMGALGLFQFIRATFSELDDEWGLLDDNQNTRESYLTNPKLSVSLAGKWLKKLREGQSGDMLHAIVEHNAGPVVEKWKKDWVYRWARDVEYRAETVGFRETRNFVRHVLLDVAMAKASACFQEAGR